MNIQQKVCEHGQLRRQCELCEKDAEIADLRVQLVEKEKKIADLQERLKPVEEVHKKYYKDDGNYGSTDSPVEYLNNVQKLAEDLWQAICAAQVEK